MKGKLTWTLTGSDGKVISKPGVLSNGYTPHTRSEQNDAATRGRLVRSNRDHAKFRHR